MKLKGRTIFVTGGASGMGRETARLLLQNGANVAVFDRTDATDQFADAGGRAIAITGDVSSADDLRVAVKLTTDRFGQLHHAVNAAGITGKLGPILDQPDDAMDALLAINVKGMFMAMKQEAEIMRHTGGGSIVNFASVYSKGSHPNMVLYGATKHAVVGLTEGAAIEFAQYGIRVNAVAPGPILTPFIGDITPEIEASVVRGIPQARIGKPNEVAGAVVWLLSDEASYVTGANLTVDGGQSALLAG